MASKSLRTRILLLFWGLLLLVFIPMYVFLAHTVKNDLLLHSQERARHLLDASCWLFGSGPSSESAAWIQTWATDLGSRLDARLTLVQNGRVLADSHVRRERLGSVEDHGNRPEIMAAARGEVGLDIRRSSTIGRDLIYTARLCPAHSPRQTVLRLAVPLSELYDRLETLKKQFLAILAACLMASAALSFALSRGIAASISRTVESVSKIGRGNYSQRMDVRPGTEFAPLAEAVNSMAAAISSHVSAMQEQKAQLEALFNGLSEGVLALDQDGRIISANPAFQRFFPMLSRIEGQTLLAATLEPDLDAAVKKLLHEGAEQETCLLLNRPGGRELEARINLYRDPAGKIRCVVVVQDVSLSRRMEKIRRDFVANVSHELRTPLTSIKGYAETLLGDPPPEPETARAFLQVIHKNAGHMANMVTDLLKLAKLESEAPIAPLGTVDARQALDAAMEICAPLAAAKAVRFDARFALRQALVQADQNQLAQVFKNLLENAVRFSPRKGKVAVEARIQGEYVVFAITDQGPGIPRDQQERLFERFYRQDAARSEANGGTGLGLAICKHIIRNHGGRIWVESVPGEGAAFFFTLKAVRPAGHPQSG